MVITAPSLAIAFFPLAQGEGQGGLPMGLLLMVAMIAVMYFLMIRPQQKRQRQHMEMVSNLKKGDKVITRGGIHGIITLVRDREVVLKVDDNCKLTLSKGAVAAVVSPTEGEGGKDKEGDKG
ncbi:MAG: preprotein translocase subunit YajC [Planctomycetes bacterium]|nr:preprotein translocase subunit YajC [Planctomycetota bacterium]